jgi:uncharacterized membrane protein YeaQ/YmgE (transglycosylase-associated protein family)
VLIGLISGFIAKSVMHTHMTIFWTIVLGVIGSIIGGAVTHMLWRPTNSRYHPAGFVVLRSESAATLKGTGYLSAPRAGGSRGVGLEA